MLINTEKRDIRLVEKSINDETLQELCKCISKSFCPELEADYLAKEFHFATDELFLMYIENKKELEIYKTNTLKIVSTASKIITYERRKSSPPCRLKYGILKILNEATQINASFGNRLNYKNEKSRIQFFLENELSRYNFIQKQSGKNVSTLDILDKITDLDFNSKYIDFVANELLIKILENFDVSIPAFRASA